MPERRGLLELFAQHDVAANLLMVLLLLAGIWSIRSLNTQVDPDPSIPWIEIRAAWSGASAEDLERLVTTPIEIAVRNATGRQRTHSVTRAGQAELSLLFEREADLGVALDEVKRLVAGIRDLPAELEQIEIRPILYKPHVASILVTGDGSLDELVPIVREMERDLRSRGIDEIYYDGLPREEIAIEVSSLRLRELGIGLDQLAERVAALSRDVPAGTIGRGNVARQLRSLERKADVEAFRRMSLTSGEAGAPILLGDVATVVRRPMESEVRVTHAGRPAIEMQILRTADTDLLERSRILREWVDDTRASLGPGVELVLYKESSTYFSDLAEVIIRNGATGLALVVVVLFMFLSGRVAVWVMLGIPVSFMGAIALYQLFGGGSLNVVMMFALVMCFGIVVDDAIVVGEEAYARYRAGAEPLDAAVSGARRMLGPVLASSLTTLAAFLPVLVIGEKHINVIPLTLACVILASLVECFLVLPGHLRHRLGFGRGDARGRSGSAFRRRFDAGFERFRDERFRPALRLALDNRGPTLATVAAALLLALSLVASGRIGMNLSLGLQNESAEANVQFATGTSASERDALLRALEDALEAASARFERPAYTTFVTKQGVARFGEERQRGEQYGSVIVELTKADEREFSNREFAAAWRAAMRGAPGIERLQVEARGGRNRGGPDLTLSLSGSAVELLKAGAEELAAALAAYPGVANVSDDLPYGDEQWVLTLTTEGRALGLSVDSIGRQLRSAYDGRRVQIVSEGDERLEVRVMLASDERRDLASLAGFPILTPSGETVPLASVAGVHSRRGIDVIRHVDGRNAVSVSASVDPLATSPQRVIADVKQNALADILERYDLEFGLGGRSAEEAKLLATLSLGAVLGLALIYIVLAGIFASYAWPLAIMTAIPLGLTGALFGHWVMGRQISPMSLLGVFTLTGVVVNDSIVLVSFYKDLRAQGVPVREAIEEATCQRLRAVIVTSLTTVIGLAPLMFEPSPIASYLTPLATTIVWGMSYATVLVVFAIPALLLVIESVRERFASGGARMWLARGQGTAS